MTEIRSFIKMKYLPAKLIMAALTLACLAGYGGLSTVCAEGKEEKQKPVALNDHLLDLGKGVTMQLAEIPAGKFMMGSTLSAAEVAKVFTSKEERHTNEHPRREVTISRPFDIGIHEVTQAQWRAVMGTEPWKGKISGKPGDDYAAGWMNWTEANAFCQRLSKSTGKTVTLPTEAQWEYACRAGTETEFCFGDDPGKMGDYAWYQTNARKTGEEYAHAVGKKKPNAWGLYDMHGNVWEWCRDGYAADFYTTSGAVDPENTSATQLRAVRGGSWHNDPLHCRSAGRNSWTGTSYRHYNYGFRVIVMPAQDAK
jgi:formylglycine-generating enzyme required for sulfatase activity